MKLLIDRVTATPERYEFEAPPSLWQEEEASPSAVSEQGSEPLRFELRAYRMAEDLLLEGEVRGRLELECSRCLARYPETIQESFRLLLEPAGARVPTEPDAAHALAENGMCLGDELETGWYQGTLIDLSAFFRELVILAMPAKPLCREECLGLCPQCGADRNKQSCTCSKVDSTSPFAVLAKLRGGSGPEPKKE